MTLKVFPSIWRGARHSWTEKKIELTPKEYELLFYLVENKNIALSRDKFSDIWGYDFFGDDRTIDTHIKNLRNSFGTLP